MSALFPTLNGLLLAIALLLLLPIGVLLIECLAALLPIRESWQSSSSVNDSPSQVNYAANRSSNRATALSGAKVAVLVPAHNEAAGIYPVLEGLVAQLRKLPGCTELHRLIVVADNCTDDTAEIARSTGAAVLERHDPDRRGKGYALDYGVRFLTNDPPDVLVIVDADCDVKPGTIERISRKALTTNRPVQAVYLMERPAQPKPKDAVSALAFLVKNLVRPRGMERLGLPSPLTGTGMAFPWSVIRSAKLASGNIVEDMQLGVDLAIEGYPPAVGVDTLVMGRLPQQEQAAQSQRTRWEHGHLQTLLTQVPRLLKASLKQKRFDLLAMALDLAIPPLSLLVIFWLAGFGLSIGLLELGGSSLPAILLGLDGLPLLLAIAVAWYRFGRSELPLMSLLAIPFYVLWKIPLYFAFLVRRQKKWVRTDRDVR
ncbi:glycosyltransferase family 2 protein [Leptolyngbya ohadii]|uniref:glycosyltransferase family 2 protein n=1 Tax=Leptolyngbya ohadii TaxID=1962290 RepID=UPI0021F0DBC2|nr:glycosyltransferase family 2 protein [Leptolyngbya ohadii]